MGRNGHREGQRDAMKTHWVDGTVTDISGTPLLFSLSLLGPSVRPLLLVSAICWPSSLLRVFLPSLLARRPSAGDDDAEQRPRRPSRLSRRPAEKVDAKRRRPKIRPRAKSQPREETRAFCIDSQRRRRATTNRRIKTNGGNRPGHRTHGRSLTITALRGTDAATGRCTSRPGPPGGVRGGGRSTEPQI